MKKTIGKFFWIIYLFYFLFYPPIFSLPIFPVLGLIAWGYIGINFKKIRKYIDIKNAALLYLMIGVVTLYGFISVAVHKESFSDIAGLVYWLFSIIPAGLAAIIFIKDNDETIFSLFDLLLAAGMLQAVTALLAYIFPEVHSAFLHSMFTQEDLDTTYGWVVEIRMYGYSLGLNFGTPVVEAMLAIYALYKAVNVNIKYIVFVPFLAFTAVINARTSMVVIALTGLIILMQKKDKKAIIKTAVLVAFTVVAVGALAEIIFSQESFGNLMWIGNGITETINFFRGKADSGYYSVAFGEQFMRLPEGTVPLIFGMGERAMGGNEHGGSSDIGYVNDIWLGGIVYCVLLYAVLFAIVIIAMRRKGRLNNEKHLWFYLGASSMLLILFMSIKMYIDSLNGFSNLLMLILTYGMCEKTLAYSGERSTGNEKISVIIPVYNVEPYLRKCLDSVCGQTYKNLEIIVVDDGSTDGSPAICDEYAEKDNRIICIHQENAGLSCARNAGIDAATGDWIAFVDSDDWIDTDMYETLMWTAESTKADIVECGTKDCSTEGALRKYKGTGTIIEKKPAQVISGIYQGDVRFEVWNKLWRRETIGDIRFIKGQVSEDVHFDRLVFAKAEKTAYVDKFMHNYLIQRPGNTNSSFKKARMCIFDEFKAWMAQQELDKKQQKTIGCLALDYAIAMYVTAEEKNQNDKTLRKIKRWADHFYTETSNRCKNRTLKDRFKAALFKKNPEWYLKLRKINL